MEKDLKEKCMEIIRGLTPEELEAYVQTNYRIKERNKYGMRYETVNKPRKTTICIWSNNSKRWRCGPLTKTLFYEPGKREIRLDANMFLTPYPYSVVQKFEECLQPLPLYYCSTEAKMRGEVDPIEAAFCWALKQLEKYYQEGD